jgi:hypothetical protein
MFDRDRLAGFDGRAAGLEGTEVASKFPLLGDALPLFG